MFGINTKVGGIWTRQEFDTNHIANAHEIKSLAGAEFHKKFVEAICAFDENGKVLLYLVKNPSGKCITREIG